MQIIVDRGSNDDVVDKMFGYVECAAPSFFGEGEGG